jgi:hypothetical protein
MNYLEDYYRGRGYSKMNRIKLKLQEFIRSFFDDSVVPPLLFLIIGLSLVVLFLKFSPLTKMETSSFVCFFLIVLIIGAIILYLGVVQSKTEHNDRFKKERFSKQIFQALESKLLTDTDTDFDELLILFESISEIEKSDRLFDQSLDQYLDYAIASLYQPEESSKQKRDIGYMYVGGTLYQPEESSKQKQDSVEKTRNIIKQIKKYKALNLKKNPNLYLPDYERQLFESITVYLDDNNIDMVKEKLSQLSGAVKTVHESVAKNTKITKWSYYLAIVGLVLAVLPGISQAWAWLSHIFNLVK